MGKNKSSGLGVSLSRRRFIQSSSAISLASLFAIGKARGEGPSINDKINVACIGTGWQGLYNTEVFMQDRNARVVAVCDPYKEGQYMQRGVCGREPARRMVNQYYDHDGPESSGCAGYADYREMLAERDDIDAVVITTPDHLHAVIALEAIRKGMHVFCEKPLGHSLKEVRLMTEAAHKAGVATQMGNWGHGLEDIRRLCEMIWSGAIGAVREVHAWANRPGGWWPYGIDRSEDEPPVPEGLDWDLWLGPAAWRPWHPAYHPFIWRGWWDFGSGALGDMACHILDPVVWALHLGAPESAEGTSVKLNSRSTPFGGEMPDWTVHPETTTAGAQVRWHFPARDSLPPVKLTWSDGGLKPSRPDVLGADQPMGDSDGGVLFLGDEGMLLCGCYGSNPQLLPESKMKAYTPPEPMIPRSVGHYKEWILACRGEGKAVANWDYSGPLTEIVTLGIAAIRADRKLLWDPKKMTFPNAPDFEYLINPTLREGWSF